MDYKEFQDFARELTQASSEEIVPHFRSRRLTVEHKADLSPVTLADRNAERRLRELIHARFPSHGFIGEELGSENADAEFVWALDPIDGTHSFVAGCPLFGTLIALMHLGQPRYGVIHQPVLDQFCIGNSNETTVNGEVVRVRPCKAIEQATLLLTDRAHFLHRKEMQAYETLERDARLVRTWGDCYGYLLVASGFADVMLDSGLSPWDLMALIPVIRGAGGKITDWAGGDPTTGDSTIAAGPELHSEVLQRLA